MLEDKVERIECPSPALPWERLVWQRYRNSCANCGGKERLRAILVVPIEAGGQQIDSNGVLLCRSCEMASDSVKKGKVASDQRLVNFWVSRRLFEALHNSIKNHKEGVPGFRSMGALVRYLIFKYVEDETRFDDLLLYQDDGADVKVNIWVGKALYSTFKGLLDAKGITVTDAVKSLIRMFEEGSEPLITRPESLIASTPRSSNE